MNTPTPGPWFATQESKWNNVASIGRAWNIATARPLSEMGHPKADARLIAAAPELLAALQELIAHRDECKLHDYPAVTRARAAIRKATGSES